MAEFKIDNRKDVMLLLLYSPGVGSAVNEPIIGRTRLMKMLFLFKKEALDKFRKGMKITEENFYEFFAWDFGPFSKDVYDDLIFFLLRGFIDAKPSDVDTVSEAAEEWRRWVLSAGLDFGMERDEEYVEEEFKLTTKGEEFTGAKLYSALSEAQKTLLKEFKGKLVQKPLRAILHYVYSEYPETIEKSKIKGEVLGN